MGQPGPKRGSQRPTGRGRGSKIDALAKSLGIDKRAALAKISEFLPKVIDKLTPNGQLPADSLVGEALEMLKQSMPAKAGV